MEPCNCCPFAPCWLIIIAHVVVEAAAVTRVWASQTTQCYAELHSVGITDYTALRSVGNEHPLQKGQEVCTCELCFICFQFLPRIFIVSV